MIRIGHLTFFIFPWGFIFEMVSIPYAGCMQKVGQSFGIKTDTVDD